MTLSCCLLSKRKLRTGGRKRPRHCEMQLGSTTSAVRCAAPASHSFLLTRVLRNQTTKCLNGTNATPIWGPSSLWSQRLAQREACDQSEMSTRKWALHTRFLLGAQGTHPPHSVRAGWQDAGNVLTAICPPVPGSGCKTKPALGGRRTP